MQPAQWTDAGEGAAVPDRWALRWALQSLARADKPRAVAARQVVVRLHADQPPYSTFTMNTTGG